MIYLKQSTAATVRVGPFVDATNGVTPETGVTLSGADQAEILKQGSGATVDISGATWAAITGVGGWYDLSLTTSHTDTVGALYIIVQDESVCLPVFMHCTVLKAEVYDALIAGTDLLYTHPGEFSTSGSTITLYELDGTTTQATRTATTNASADPITGLT